MKSKLIIFYFLIICIFLSINTGRLNAEFKIKALHLPLRRASQIPSFYLTIDRIVGKFNAIIIQLNNNVSYKSRPEIVSDEAENMRKIIKIGQTISINELRNIILYANKKGIEVIPELKLLTHQEKLFRRTYPQLMINEVTYDPNKKKVYEIVFDLIDELLRIFNPTYFHIGHDEMREYWKTRPNHKSVIPSYEEYAYHANKISTYLKNKGVKTLMWGDMLINPKHFNLSKKMLKTSFHGDIQNYYKAIEQLDRDIIIVDWHNWGDDKRFPSIDYFLSKGFRVIGSTWKNPTTIYNFGKYLCNKNNENIIGVIATTWGAFVRQEKKTLESIISYNNTAFSCIEK